MKNLHLVDVHYLKDLDSILQEELPRCIVEVGCWDGFLLQHAYTCVKSLLTEGSPLEVVALVQNERDIDGVRRKLQDIPHKLMLYQERDSLPQDCISIVAFADAPVDFIGSCQIVLKKHELGTIRSFLLERAGQGYFPKAGQSFHYQGTYTLTNFEKRPYKARTATLADLPTLVALDEASWATGLANSKEALEKRIQNYPEGQIVLEMDGEVVAAMYSQKISSIEEALSLQSRTVESLANPQGYVLQLLSLNVFPEKQRSGLASILFEFFLQLAEVDPAIKEAMGITRCASYPGPEVCSQLEYICKVGTDGRPKDPILRMHVSCGGVIQQLVKNYRPEDVQNQGHGVLSSFPLNKRNIYKTRKAPTALSSPIELYETVWKEAEKPEKKPLPYDRLWLIFANKDDPYAYRLRELLREARQYCILVEPSSFFEQKSDELFSINPESPDDFAKLFSKLTKLSQLAGVVYLWGGFAQEIASQRPAIVGLTNLANALDFLVSPAPCSLWVGADGGLMSSPLGGLSSVIQMEYPDLHCHFFIHEGDDPAPLLTELESQTIEPVLAWKDNTRFVRRMVRAEIPSQTPFQFKSEKSYLVAGGFRQLSLRVAQWYVAHGVKKLILIDSIDPTPEAEEAKKHFEAQGVNVSLNKVNLHDIDEMRRLFSGFCDLDGLIHFIPTVNDLLLRQMTWDKYKYIYEMRVLGSFNLHELTKEMKLDHFVLFSSVVTEFSYSGKANRAVACSFLDALAECRRELKLPSLSIGWGLWSLKSVDFMHLTETRRLQERIEPFQTDQALQMLDKIFYYPKPQVSAAIINWKAVPPNPLFTEITK